MTDKEKKNKIADILLDFYDEYRSNEINRPMIPSIYAGKILDTLQEEPVSEDLEEACEQLAENARKHKAETLSPFFSQTDYKQGVIDGANLQKQIMMKDAVEAEITKISPNDHLRVVSDVLPLKDESEWGTKVKLIIIKED